MPAVGSDRDTGTPDAIRAVLRGSGVRRGSAPSPADREEVRQATGMIMIQPGVSAEEAPPLTAHAHRRRARPAGTARAVAGRALEPRRP